MDQRFLPVTSSHSQPLEKVCEAKKEPELGLNFVEEELRISNFQVVTLGWSQFRYGTKPLD